jgi:hypothetical protein
MPYYEVPPGVLSKGAALHKWARIAIAVPRKSSKKKAPSKKK